MVPRRGNTRGGAESEREAEVGLNTLVAVCHPNRDIQGMWKAGPGAPAPWGTLKSAAKHTHTLFLFVLLWKANPLTKTGLRLEM
jgi:hypothetical protein